MGVKSYFKQPDYSPPIPANAAYVPVLAGNFPVAPTPAAFPRQGGRSIHQIHVDRVLGARLHTLHNLYYYQSLMKSLRVAIEARQLDQFSKRFYAGVAPDLRIRARIETRLFTGETLWTY